MPAALPLSRFGVPKAHAAFEARPEPGEEFSILVGSSSLDNGPL